MDWKKQFGIVNRMHYSISGEEQHVVKAVNVGSSSVPLFSPIPVKTSFGICFPSARPSLRKHHHPKVLEVLGEIPGFEDRPVAQ